MAKEGHVALAPQQEMRKKIELLLPYVNKPSRYIGNEEGSQKKEWTNNSTTICLAFPDLYEIGISNLGHRILYYLINNSNADYIADRVYAPDNDFKRLLEKEDLPLYGVESFRSLIEFDSIAFSLQYELSYPTILSMLNLAQIPLRSSNRDENHPIICAGGPGSYNPEPLREFIDVFFIGDGEDILIEYLNEIERSKKLNLTKIETLKNIAKLDGVYVPSLYEYSEDENRINLISKEAKLPVKKRISLFQNNKFPVDFPIPSCLAVHDRAVVEIRRGCGRMCRFCQSCFVNLPVRERHPDEVMELTDKVLKNTGYDEYSLLSLSSSDYRNIEILVEALNKNYAGAETSISMPSQRADAFSVNLANMVQSVRKSTLTFAPEAGSQRMRDVINKNLGEEEIINAVISAYKAGWSSVKLYFMIGLPTETFEDLDEMINLLSKIKWISKKIKAENNINKPLELTCTVSIFVPKPFTPFQWFGQNTQELIREKVRYLKDKIKSIKGVKLNYHEPFLSLLEAVFSRGDSKLNDLIEKVFEKGSYLDAWSENFNKEIWLSAAKELDIDFEDYACKEFDTKSVLTWDFIQTGVSKDWLINEYNKSLNFQNSTPCDKECSSCGVCESYNTSCSLNELHNFNNLNKITEIKKELSKDIYKYRLKIQKKGDLKYISHLDWNRLIYRACRKAGIPLHFSQGFNPSPKISISLALPLFVESEGEIVEIELIEPISLDELTNKLNEVLPINSKVINVSKIDRNCTSVDKETAYAKYIAAPLNEENVNVQDFEKTVKNILDCEKIEIEKYNHKKKQTKIIDIRPLIHDLQINETDNEIKFILKTGQNGNLRPDELVEYISKGNKWNITRESIYDKDFKEL